MWNPYALALRISAIVLVPGLGVSTSWGLIPTGSVTVKLEKVATVNTGQTGAPHYLTHAGDGSGRMFVVGQAGQILLIKDGQLQQTPFLDIPNLPPTTEIPFTNGGERGLLGLAFHPDFAASADTPGSGKLYTYTSERGTDDMGAAFTPDFNHPELGLVASHHTVIREWTVSSTSPDQIDTSVVSRELMRINQPQGNHNGGAIAFDADGLLHIALGDGGGSNDNLNGVNNPSDGHTNGIGNSQDLSNVYGSILRIDPVNQTGDTSANGQYSVPTSNPFVDNPSAVDEIFAYGLRNPFRISFDRDTGDLYAGDVGQSSVEEVDLIEPGGNHGWVFWEGTRLNRNGGPAFEDTVGPIGEYDNPEDGRSVIGGFVYRGSQVPELFDKYVFGDLGPNFVVGRLFYMDLPPNPGDPYGPIQEFMLDPSGESITSLLHGIGEDEDGELYALFRNGDVVRFAPGPRTDGDANLDGRVDAEDLNILALNWQQAVVGFTDADFDGNGFVDAADLNLLALNWQFGVPEGEAPSAAALDMTSVEAAVPGSIPEPTTGLVLFTGVAIWIRHRISANKID